MSVVPYQPQDLACPRELVTVNMGSEAVVAASSGAEATPEPCGTGVDIR